ncbi:HAD family hydrolase [Polynucleobacter sp. AP-Ainpum-60-G11]|uniref:HAD family hydrolase n=1 Tax=Polynucleobacter sp. AP-Ainpum-60-G11 TaxID=2576926 RepID=UPI001BFE8371|nr:HAD-IA family hydrolase [Polynucleobacter sp. AP-Ainpum-60-G11]QWE27014.1 HAD family hydrolase [Polynucleobacter sp. AP-Ainpum-60-G11]
MESNMGEREYEIIKNSEIIFWDFDGVIKDSVNAKAQAFANLFIDYSVETQNKIINHHIFNAGVSRDEKIKQYIRWTGREPNEEIIKLYTDKYSTEVVRKVIESPWVPGVIDFLRKDVVKKYNILLTATPHHEILLILKLLNIHKFFFQIYGYPTVKELAMAEFIKSTKADSNKCVMIGDSIGDMRAAKSNNISFILRSTKYNSSINSKYRVNNFL